MRRLTRMVKEVAGLKRTACDTGHAEPHFACLDGQPI